jgi:hypothetical protein
VVFPSRKPNGDGLSPVCLWVHCGVVRKSLTCCEKFQHRPQKYWSIQAAELIAIMPLRWQKVNTRRTTGGRVGGHGREGDHSNKGIEPAISGVWCATTTTSHLLHLNTGWRGIYATAFGGYIPWTKSYPIAAYHPKRHFEAGLICFNGITKSKLCSVRRSISRSVDRCRLWK